MKIYIDGRVLIPRRKSGVGLYVTSIIKALDEILEKPESDKDLDVKILIPKRAKVMVKNELKLRKIGFRSIPLPFRGMNLLSRLNLLPPLDIFYGKGIYIFPAFTRERLITSPSIVFFYDFAFKKFPDSLNQKQRQLLDSRYESSLLSDGVLTISDSVAKEIIKIRKSKDGVSIARPAVDRRHFYRRSIDEITIVKNRLRISGAYILFVGNIEPRKNIKSLIQAYKLLSPELLDRYSLVIVGAESWSDNSTIDYIKAAIREGYKIKILIGDVTNSDLPSIYSGASVFVFPSVYEGFGMPIVEAMACGVPVITGQSPEITEAAGGASLSVSDVTNPHDIHIAIEKLLKNKAEHKKLVNKGLQRITDDQDWSVSAKILYDLIVNIKEKIK